MRTALLIEVLQVVGGLALVFFAGKRLFHLRKRPKGAADGDTDGKGPSSRRPDGSDQ